MNAERWAQINALFDAVVELDLDQRDAFLQKEAHGDSELISQVRQLLASESDASAKFLDHNPLNVNQHVPANKTSDMIGIRLGAYEISKRLGSGGMGNVYLAARIEDFKQRVAIKILKRGLDSEDIVKRFHREIRCLAALGQHPNIARLIDAGVTEDGRPYFVMEFVEGDEIDRYCDRNKLSIRDRVQLFQNVCAAVHIAHQHTIIHRDIKPSNILVNSQGTAKLIDFGIAKLTAPELAADTAMHTSTEYRVMTPEYASPEQVRGEAITTACDVYSLGVVLYQLLTGRRPYRIESRAPQAVEQVVCHQEPQRPSTVVGVAADTQRDGKAQTVPPEAISTQRQTVPHTLRRTLRGDLDNIVMMALRKEPRDRYASAGQFAVDLGRYLNGEPVAARRLGTLQRLARTCRCYPVAAGLIAALLLGGGFGLGYLSQLSQQLVRSTALESAAQQTEMLYHGHKYYTRVLDRIKETSPEASTKLKPPATFTIELFDFLNKSQDRVGTLARMLSRYPFTSRAKKAKLDDFEEHALEYFETDQGDAFHRFEPFGHQPYLRYAIAMRMDQSCCDCHNTHPDSTKTDWQPGQVRGILEVMRPLANDTRRIRSGLLQAAGWIGFVIGGAFTVTSLLLRARRS